MCVALTVTEDKRTSLAHTQVPQYNSCHMRNKKLIHEKKSPAHIIVNRKESKGETDL